MVRETDIAVRYEVRCPYPQDETAKGCLLNKVTNLEHCKKCRRLQSIDMEKLIVKCGGDEK